MGKFMRDRQGRWDKRYLVTVSTHLTRREYDVLMGVCAALGTKPYAIVRDYLREYCRQAQNRLERDADLERLYADLQRRKEVPQYVGGAEVERPICSLPTIGTR